MVLVESSPPVLSRWWGWKEEEEAVVARSVAKVAGSLCWGVGEGGERSVQGVGRYGKLGENCNKLSFAAQYSFSSAQ